MSFRPLFNPLTYYSTLDVTYLIENYPTASIIILDEKITIFIPSKNRSIIIRSNKEISKEILNPEKKKETT